MAPRSDRGTGAVGWLLRIALVVGSLGVVGYDAAAIGVGHLTLDDTAAAAALEGRQAIAETRDTRRGYRAALDRAQADSADITLAPKDFTVAPDGEVRLRLERTAGTLLAHRIPALRQHVAISAVGTARPATMTG